MSSLRSALPRRSTAASDSTTRHHRRRSSSSSARLRSSPFAASPTPPQQHYDSDTPSTVSGGGGPDATTPRQPSNAFDSASAMTSTSSTSQDFALQGERALAKLKELYTSKDWKKVLSHKSGVHVHVAKNAETVLGKNVPVFKGEGIIKGYSPASVFAVVGNRKYWDEWYEQGNLVENLNDTTSLTYMCMKGIVGSSTRDLALVEKVEGTAQGIIYFCSTSVDTPRVPKVSGRTRAHIALNGWIMEPVMVDGKPATKISYFLQVDVKSFVPSAFSSRYMARRPLCITKIDDYLQKNGAPAIAGVSESERHAGAGGGKPARNMAVDQASILSSSASALGVDSKLSTRSRRNSNSSSRRSRLSVQPIVNGSVDGAIIDHVKINESFRYWSDLKIAKSTFQHLTGPTRIDWTSAQDPSGFKIWYFTQNKSDLLPIVKGECEVENVTSEQVLLTISSTAAARIWNDRLGDRQVLFTELSDDVSNRGNGFDQCTVYETLKGIFPHLATKWYTLAKHVEREQAGNDNSKIQIISTSVNVEDDVSKMLKSIGGTEGEKCKVIVDGWSIDAVDSNGSCALTHISQVDISPTATLSPFLHRIIVSGMASGPRNVKEFIEQRGHAPGFIRWGQGLIDVVGDDGNFESGHAWWQLLKRSGTTSAENDQLAWFQWSGKMYPKGIKIKFDPISIASVVKLEGMTNAIQFKWDASKFPTDKPVTLFIEPSTSTSSAVDQVWVNETLLVESISSSPAKGLVNGTSDKKKRKSSSSGGGSRRKPSTMSNGEVNQAEPKDSNVVNGVSGLSNRKSSRFLNVPTTSSSETSQSSSLSNQQQQQQQPASVDSKQRLLERQVPEDAMLIITNELYFSRSQVAFMMVLTGLAFMYGKWS